VIAVDHVEAEDNRNVQTGFVNGNVLPLIHFPGIADPKNGAGAIFSQDVLGISVLLLEFTDREAGKLRKLGDLLFERHLLEEVFGVGMRLGEAKRQIEERDCDKNDRTGEFMIREKAGHGVVVPPFGNEQFDLVRAAGFQAGRSVNLRDLK
jgi:hypothetical protein